MGEIIVSGIRETYRDAAKNWEMITASGVLIKGQKRVRTLHELGIKGASIVDLRRAFPSLCSENSFDREILRSKQKQG